MSEGIKRERAKFKERSWEKRDGGRERESICICELASDISEQALALNDNLDMNNYNKIKLV